MNVFVSNPRLLFDLQFFLRRAGCATKHVRPHELEVEVPDAPSPEQARREVELYVALWRARKGMSGISAELVVSVSPEADGGGESVPEAFAAAGTGAIR